MLITGLVSALRSFFLLKQAFVFSFIDVPALLLPEKQCGKLGKL
jgi:hypothetical protein